MSGVLGFDSRRGLGIFLFTTESRPALGPTQPSIQWMLGALPLGVKWLGREADHSSPSSAEAKECVDLYLCFPNTPSWRGAQLKRSTGTTLYFTPYDSPENIGTFFHCAVNPRSPTFYGPRTDIMTVGFLGAHTVSHILQYR